MDGMEPHYLTAPDVFISGGPESVITDTPPKGLPTTGPVGFTAPLRTSYQVRRDNGEVR